MDPPKGIGKGTGSERDRLVLTSAHCPLLHSRKWFNPVYQLWRLPGGPLDPRSKGASWLEGRDGEGREVHIFIASEFPYFLIETALENVCRF